MTEMMRLKVLLTVLLTSVLLLAACSYRCDFVVINKSSEVMEVQYTLKRHPPEAPGKFVDVNPPAKMSVEEFEKSERGWRTLQEGQYSFDNAAGTFTVSVAPDEALLVDYAYNYQGDEIEFDLA